MLFVCFQVNLLRGIQQSRRIKAKLANLQIFTAKLANFRITRLKVTWLFPLHYPANIYSNRNKNSGYIITFSLFLSLSLCLSINIQFYYICNFHFIQIVLRSNNCQHLQQYHHSLCDIVNQWQYCITVNNNYLPMGKISSVNKVIYC